VAAALALAGSRLGAWLAAPGDGALYRLVIGSLAGWVGLHLLLTALGAAGVPWSLPAIAAASAAIVAAAWAAAAVRRRFLAARRGRQAAHAGGNGAARLAPVPAPRPGWGWGDAVALAALLVFAAWALSLWVANPDFVYHWGLKGNRFYLARGIDYGYLARSWNWVIHPDYPNLLPELFATTALAAGRWDEPAMMLWSPICLGLLLAAAREALRRAGVGRFTAQAALAGLALLLAAYGIGGLSAGGADWLIALALTAAMPPLLAPPGPAGAAQIGVIAAFAAASKMEGLPLAASLIVVYAARLWAAANPAAAGAAAREELPAEAGAAARAELPAEAEAPRQAQAPGKAEVPGMAQAGMARAGTAELRGRWGHAPAMAGRAFAALLLPAAAVVLPWLAEVRRHHLFQAFNSGPVVPARLPGVLSAILAALLRAGEWHGLVFALALLPLLALDRRLRALAAIVFAQLLFYLYVYLSVRIDAEALVAASAPRIVLHLLPAVLTGAAIALDGPGAGAGVERPAAGGARTPGESRSQTG
jgi:hypothetical protein